MTTTTSRICPRCAYDDYQEYRRETWAEYRGGFLAGFVAATLLAFAILTAMSGVMG